MRYLGSNMCFFFNHITYYSTICSIWLQSLSIHPHRIPANHAPHQHPSELQEDWGGPWVNPRDPVTVEIKTDTIGGDPALKIYFRVRGSSPQLIVYCLFHTKKVSCALMLAKKQVQQIQLHRSPSHEILLGLFTRCYSNGGNHKNLP